MAGVGRGRCRGLRWRRGLGHAQELSRCAQDETGGRHPLDLDLDRAWKTVLKELRARRPTGHVQLAANRLLPRLLPPPATPRAWLTAPPPPEPATSRRAHPPPVDLVVEPFDGLDRGLDFGTNPGDIPVQPIELGADVARLSLFLRLTS